MIEARRLVKQFGAVTALAGLSVKVPEGRVGLLGPNGAGKSTFIKLALGIFAPSGGSVTVLGENVTTAGPELRQRIGYMPEHDCLPDRLTGVEFVVEMAQVSGMDRQAAIQRTHEVLNHLRMGEEKYRPISEYSGGMRQKVKLAQGLVHGPELVILDEPTSGLDPQARQLIWRRVRRLRAAGVTVLLTTHYMEEASQLADRVMVMYEGKILLEGTPENLVSSEVGREVVELWNVSDAVRAFLKERDWPMEEVEGRLYISDQEGGHVAHEIESHFPAQDRQIRRATLEDVFLRRTGRALKD